MLFTLDAAFSVQLPPKPEDYTAASVEQSTVFDAQPSVTGSRETCFVVVVIFSLEKNQFNSVQFKELYLLQGGNSRHIKYITTGMRMKKIGTVFTDGAKLHWEKHGWGCSCKQG